ncbi:MAG: hypothetical protein ACOYVD_15205 [Bacillota bacterium]
MEELRKEFVKQLLLELKIVYERLDRITREIEGISAVFLEEFYTNNREIIQKDIERLKLNIEKIKNNNYEVIEAINQWYGFVNNVQEMGKTFFPLKFLWKRYSLKKSIKKTNQKISKLSVDNRLIRENLKNKEKELELKAVQEMKKSGLYKEYEDLLGKKGQYIFDLIQVLSTLPFYSDRELDLENIDGCIEELG